jgi:endonuclease/exonuclease/phosphatase family metal-dependent hydrolase
MTALRLMTFNVQMLPLVAALTGGTSDDAEERAERVANAILNLPPAEQPDVIAFNEVFSEDGRDKLQNMLAAWGNMVVKMDDGGILDEDSGLMLVSKLPFQTLPTGGKLYEHFYSDSADTDARAAKGVGIVQVPRPAETTTIAFTHLQASYTSEGQYRDIRAKQFGAIHSALSHVLGSDDDEWRNVILIGDLNVRGDAGATTNEWAKTFKSSGSPFQKTFYDGWRSYMHPPVSDDEVDPGFTNIDISNGKQQRLDYHCFTQAGVPSTGAVPHHMFTRLRDQSDHFALEAVIERWSPNCCPAQAIEMKTIDPYVSGAGEPTTMRLIDVNFRDIDAFQWIYVDRPGTFTVYAPSNVRVRLFLETDLSSPISMKDTLLVTNTPPAAQEGVAEVPLDPEGSTFATRRPFFIALQLDAVDPGPTTVAVFEHLGDAPERAIWLTPHVEVRSSFPLGQPLGTDDVCWFKAKFPTTFAGTPHDETFTFRNGTGENVLVTLMDTALTELDWVEGTQSSLDLVANAAGDEVRLFAMKRGSYDAAGFTCFWNSPLTYLALDKATGFYVNDESGPDAVGDDEIKLDIGVDGATLFTGAWGSADTGERWTVLPNELRSRLAAVLPGQRRLPFASSILVSYIEDDFAASGWLAEVIDPLAAGEPDDVDRVLPLPVSDTISDGLYTFFYSLSRFPD